MKHLKKFNESLIILKYGSKQINKEELKDQINSIRSYFYEFEDLNSIKYQVNYIYEGSKQSYCGELFDPNTDLDDFLLKFSRSIYSELNYSHHEKKNMTHLCVICRISFSENVIDNKKDIDKLEDLIIAFKRMKTDNLDCKLHMGTKSTISSTFDPSLRINLKI